MIRKDYYAELGYKPSDIVPLANDNGVSVCGNIKDCHKCKLFSHDKCGFAQEDWIMGEISGNDRVVWLIV